MRNLDEQSYYEVIGASINFSENQQLLRGEIKKLGLTNQKLELQNKSLRLEIQNKDIQIAQLAAKIRETSRTLMRLSRGLITKQEILAEKDDEIATIKANQKQELDKLSQQKSAVQKQLRDASTMLSTQRWQNEQLKIQLQKLNQNIPEIKSSQIGTHKNNKMTEKLQQYKSLIRNQSKKNIELEYKAMRLQAQISSIKKTESKKILLSNLKPEP